MPDSPAPSLVRVLVLDPACPDEALLRDVPATLEAFRALVDGWVEPLALSRDVVMYLNEDGKRDGLPDNPAANKVAFLANPGFLPGDSLRGVACLVDARGPDLADAPEAAHRLCREAGLAIREG